MTWLFLDTHERGRIRFGWISSARCEIQDQTMHASALLPLLKAWLDKMRMSLAEAEGVCVVSGPGTFSAVRSGVLDANIVARWFGIPLVGVRAEDASDARFPLLIKRLAHETRHLAVSYIAPIYDAEPNITMPRTVAIIRQEH